MGGSGGQPPVSNTLVPLLIGLINTIGLVVVGWWSRTTKKEVTPNGGTSLRDSVNRIEVSVADMSERVDGVIHREAAQNRRIDAAHRRLDRQEDNAT